MLFTSGTVSIYMLFNLLLGNLIVHLAGCLSHAADQPLLASYRQLLGQLIESVTECQSVCDPANLITA